MRKAVLLTSILLLATTWMLAQQSYPSGSTTPDQSGSPSDMSSSSPTTVRGCLSGSEGSYILTDESGKAWQLQGKTDTLKAHVGHKVAITGTPSGGASTTSTTGSTGDSKASADISNTFQVSSFEHIAASCTTASSGEATNESHASMGMGTGTAGTAGTATATPPATTTATASEPPPVMSSPTPSSEPATSATGQAGTEPSEPTAATGDQVAANRENLPQTASPLPLLALLGLGSLGVGIFGRRKK